MTCIYIQETPLIGLGATEMEQGPVKSHVYCHDCIQQILKSVEIVYHHVKLSTNMYSTILDHSCIYEIHMYLKTKNTSGK